MNKLEFFKKEIFEILKTPKIIVLPAVALFFGMLSPITAKFINELIKTLGGGISISFPEPTYIDSYVQLFKNHYTITAIVMIFVFMGLVAEEKQRGSAILVLTKNLSRLNFILSKFFASVLLFTFAYILSAVICIYYTFILFDEFWNPNLPLAIFMFWLYGVFLIALILFASIISRSPAIAALFGFIGFAVISFLS
ncbi:MAG: ABC transporter permease, partial [Clostridia bacterium]